MSEEEDCADGEEDWAGCVSVKKGWAALGINEEMGGNVEEEAVVVAGTSDMIEDVGKVKVDDVEDTGELRRESNNRMRLVECVQLRKLYEEC